MTKPIFHQDVPEAHLLLAAIITSSDDAIISKTLRGIITSWNQGAEKIFGYSAEEVIGKPINIIIPPHLQYEEKIIISKISSGERVNHYETKRIRKDGKIIDVSLTISPVKNAEGVIVGASKIARDISDKKQREKELREKGEELVRLSQLKNEFVTMVTHELRTPLGAVSEGISLIADEIDGPLNPEQKETLDVVKRNIDRLARMVNNVLDFQKTQSQKPNLVFCDFCNLVRDVHETMKLEADRKKLQFQLDFPSQSVVAHCDTDQIKQVLINLIDNAFKFTDQGGHVFLRLKDFPHAVVLEVEDTGIGIRDEDQSKVFEMFTQVTESGYWKPGGSGVGLTITKKIIELHDGRIHLESKPGQGTLFRVCLPKSLVSP